jgi:nicotinamidase-related amidase
MDYTRPEYSAIALLTIDVQRDFLDGQPAGIPGTSAILPNLTDVVRAFRSAGRPIVHVVRIYAPDGSNVDSCRRALVEAGTRVVCPGTDGVELAESLGLPSFQRLDTDRLLSGELQSFGPREWAMYKPRWGAFFGTQLEGHLRRLGVTTLAIAGCNFPNCPRTTIYEASERDFRIVLVDDAVSGLYDRGRQELTGIGVALMSAAALITATVTTARI